jgi:hypothetical protein
MAFMTFGSRPLHVALGAALAAQCGAAAAIDFQIGENTLKFENLVTIGASWRMQDIDPGTIGKSSWYARHNPPGQGLCFERGTASDQPDDGINGPSPSYRDDQPNFVVNGAPVYTVGAITRGCSATNDAADDASGGPGVGAPSTQHVAYMAAAGSLSPNSDDGNLSFEKYDLVHAVAKLTSDISFSFADYNIFVRPIYYFDLNYTDFTVERSDTTIQSAQVPLNSAAEKRVGSDLEVLDYNISHLFSIGEQDINVKVGNQVLNWGESSLLIFNSLNSINPLDASKLRFPGADLKEFFQPIGMVVAGTDLFENFSIEGWYGYEWKELRVDPPGTYFSQSDTLGPGGFYSMAGFGKNPDDPQNLYEPIDTCSAPGSCVDGTGLLGSHSGRTFFRDFAEEAKRAPDDGGQYGAKLQIFLEDFNNGTELTFYYANYHSRIPSVSVISSDETCITTAADLSLAGACQVTPGGAMGAGVEPVPIDTLKLVVEYPEDVQMYGLSFNTTIGDYAFSGEYAHRPNLPTQIHTTDLAFAGLNPALPVTGIPGVLPNRRQGFPDFVSVYRGISGGYGPNEYIRGWEELETGQANLTVLRLIGGDNPIGASQMTILFEMGMNRVYNMPALGELQFNGGGTDTHISDGGDGSDGINPNDPAQAQGAINPTDRQNPTAHKDLKGFGTSESYGYRMLNLNRWDSAFLGANLETLTIVQHDVKGTTPGIGTNFTHGRKQIAFGLRFDYLSTYIGEVRYSWNTGGEKRDYLRDRDNIQVSFGYQF